MKRSDFEIMAPVGSFESLTAALGAGADAVYFGVEGLNMRSRSSANFTLDDLHEIVRRCKENGVKTYLTVNTIVYDEDLAKVDDIVAAAASGRHNGYNCVGYRRHCRVSPPRCGSAYLYAVQREQH